MVDTKNRCVVIVGVIECVGAGFVGGEVIIVIAAAIIAAGTGTAGRCNADGVGDITIVGISDNGINSRERVDVAHHAVNEVRLKRYRKCIDSCSGSRVSERRCDFIINDHNKMDILCFVSRGITGAVLDQSLATNLVVQRSNRLLDFLRRESSGQGSHVLNVFLHHRTVSIGFFEFALMVIVSLSLGLRARCGIAEHSASLGEEIGSAVRGGAWELTARQVTPYEGGPFLLVEAELCI
jgi:hypothetical protein